MIRKEKGHIQKKLKYLRLNTDIWQPICQLREKAKKDKNY